MRSLRPLLLAGGIVGAMSVGAATSLALNAAGSTGEAPEPTATATQISNVGTSSPAPSGPGSDSSVPPSTVPSTPPTSVPERSPSESETAGISQGDAVQIALTRSPGAAVDRIELEPEDAGLVWKVRLTAGGSEVEYEILAATGAVVDADLD